MDYIVHELTKSQTRLSDFHFHFTFTFGLNLPKCTRAGLGVET